MKSVCAGEYSFGHHPLDYQWGEQDGGMYWGNIPACLREERKKNFLAMLYEMQMHCKTVICEREVWDTVTRYKSWTKSVHVNCRIDVLFDMEWNSHNTHLGMGQKSVTLAAVVEETSEAAKCCWFICWVRLCQFLDVSLAQWAMTEQQNKSLIFQKQLVSCGSYCCCYFVTSTHCRLLQWQRLNWRWEIWCDCIVNVE